MVSTENAANAQAAKRVRRGVSNATKAVSHLKFHEKDAAANGLFVGQLSDVRVESSVNADGKTFTGLEVPRLTFEFTSCHAKADEKRYVYHTLFPVESNVDTIPEGKDEWRVNAVLAWIKHILDVFYLKGRELTTDEEDSLSLDFIDYEENNGIIEYVSVEPEAVLAAYKKLFETVAAMMNGSYADKDKEATGKACYKDANGKPIPVWMKLLRYVKNKKGDWTAVSRGELSFPSFVGEGCLELMKAKEFPKVIRIDAIKESITPKEVKKTPTIGTQAMPGMPGAMPMGGVVGASDINMSTAPTNGAYEEADSDMPF